jgi:hypothetical protein
MMWSGVDDTDAEKRLIAQEKAEGIVPVIQQQSALMANTLASSLSQKNSNTTNGVPPGLSQPPRGANATK